MHDPRKNGHRPSEKIMHKQSTGQAEHLTENMIEPSAYRLETPYNCVRPVYDSAKWAYRIKKVLQAGKCSA